MDEDAASTLRQILRDYGVDVINEPLRLESLLRDLAAPHRREVFLLVQALRTGVVQALRDVVPPASAGLVVQQCVRRLQDDLGLAPTSAEWAVRTWAEALAVPVDGPGSGSVAPSVDGPGGGVEGTGTAEEFATTPTSGRRRKALREVNDFLGRNPDDPVALAVRADLERMLGRDDAALASAADALAVNPASAVALRVRGEVHRRRGELREALGDLTHSLDLDPESPQGLVSRGETYREMGRPQAALADLDRSIALTPSSEAFAARAVLHAQQERHQEALQDARRALMWDAGGAGSTLRGRIQQLQKASSGALDLFQRSSAIAPLARKWARKRLDERRQRRGEMTDDTEE